LTLVSGQDHIKLLTCWLEKIIKLLDWHW